MKCFQCIVAYKPGTMVGPKEEVTRLNGTPLCWDHAKGQLNCHRCVTEGDAAPKKGSILFRGTLLCMSHAIKAELEEKNPQTIAPPPQNGGAKVKPRVQTQ